MISRLIITCTSWEPSEVFVFNSSKLRFFLPPKRSSKWMGRSLFIENLCGFRSTWAHLFVGFGLGSICLLGLILFFWQAWALTYLFGGFGLGFICLVGSDSGPLICTSSGPLFLGSDFSSGAWTRLDMRKLDYLNPIKL